MAKKKRRYVVFFDVTKEEHERIHILKQLEERSIRGMFMTMLKEKYGDKNKRSRT